MQIPVLNGVYSDPKGNFRASYPVNMMPVPADTGISAGYLRPAEGAVKTGNGIGLPRGGYAWRGELYRVMGTKLCKVASDGSVTMLGDVGASSRVTFTESFDKLAIVSAGTLYYWDGAALTHVTDPDLGPVLDAIWIDGYFMTTDGTSLVVTELNDPMSVNPLKYGSSEADPDPIVALLKIRNEAYAVNRYTVEAFGDVGGDGFPFERISGAQVQRGAIGTHAACVMSDAIAFLGGGRGEAPSVWLAANGTSIKLAAAEVDRVLLNYSSSDLANSVLQVRQFSGHNHLWVVLPDRTLVYDMAASQQAGEPVWFSLVSAVNSFSRYRVVDPVFCHDKWAVCDADTGDVGELSESTARQFGEVYRWEFGTVIIYNGARGAIFNSLELVGLTGRVEAGEDPYISTSWSSDGENWSQDRPIRAGKSGEFNRRLVWLQQGHMLRQRMQRFRGDSRAMITVASIEATLEALA